MARASVSWRISLLVFVFNLKNLLKMQTKIDKTSTHPLLEYQDWIICAFCFCLYLLIFNSLLLRFGPGLEDIQEISKIEWVWAAQGRWGCMLLRYCLGGGPCYPASGIAAGFMLAVATLLQTKILKIEHFYGKLLYSATSFFCFQWASRTPFACDCDSVAFSMLFCTISVYILLFLSNSKKQILFSSLALCLGLSGYQSCALYYGSLIILVLILKLQQEEHINFTFITKTFIVTFVGLALYFTVDCFLKAYVPVSTLSWAKEYQAGMTGYEALKQCSGISDVLTLFYTQVFAPVCHDVLGQRGGAASVLYPTVWIASIIYVCAHIKTDTLKKICLRSLLLTVLIFLPYATTLLLFSKEANTSRIWMAQPLVFAGVWALIYRKYHFPSKKINITLFVISCTFIFKAMYFSSAQARDEAYYIARAKEELQEMDILAKTEEAKTGLNNAPYLICGSLKEGPSGIFRKRGTTKDFYLNEPLPVFYGDKEAFAKACISSYRNYFRMPRFCIATDEQEAQYAALLSTMPCWPEAGSVKAAKNAILIKIGGPKESL